MLVPTKDRFSALLLYKDITVTVTMNEDAILHLPCCASTFLGGEVLTHSPTQTRVKDVFVLFTFSAAFF